MNRDSDRAPRRDDDIHEGLAQALGEKKTRIMDRRFIFLLAFVTAALALMFSLLQVQLAHLKQVQRTQIVGCLAQDKVLTLLSQAALQNQTRTPEQNMEISRTYLSLVQRCQ